jgi:hypothetical protein
MNATGSVVSIGASSRPASARWCGHSGGRTVLHLIARNRGSCRISVPRAAHAPVTGRLARRGWAAIRPRADWSGRSERPATGHGQPRPAIRTLFECQPYSSQAEESGLSSRGHRSRISGARRLGACTAVVAICGRHPVGG